MKDKWQAKNFKHQQRARRTRSRILSLAKRPRLTVFRSNQHVYGQIIDDQKSLTLASASDLKMKLAKKSSPIERARAVGRALAEKALALKIKQVVFDKGGYLYHGAVQALAEGAREGGLDF
ncbi:MAG: 50S ribosomal protein L18 [Patescibacteria group bacterium]